MLFLIISTPRPERPSSLAATRGHFWNWIEPLKQAGKVRSVYARAGRGVVAVFDVDSNEELHRYMNEWADIMPAQMDVYPLIDVANAKAFLAQQQQG
jgi:muconolactone delta-isomerase